MIVTRKKPGLLAAAALIMLLSCGCSGTLRPSPRLIDGQLVFSNPPQALEALRNALARNDKEQLVEIFGPDSRSLLESGDAIADANAMRAFNEAVREKAEFVVLRPDNLREPPQVVALVVGEERWPFPIALVKDGNIWRFDTDRGREEIINRRIGENESLVIALCREYVAAQREYQTQDHDRDGVNDYASKFFSTPGERDGLYWESPQGQPRSPMGPFVARAADEGYRELQSGAQPYHGYYYRILTRQGPSAPGGARNYIVNGKMTEGVGMLAYPAAWDRSGVMSFMVGPDGAVYEKNFGRDTERQVAAITEYNPDPSWKKADQTKF